MSDDLVKRLRDARRDWPEYGMDRTDAADEIERLRAENARLQGKVGFQRQELTKCNQALAARNRQLDAMAWVWCDGGCAGGVFRFTSVELNDEVVCAAERNTERLRRWLNNAKFKDEWASMSKDEREKWFNSRAALRAKRGTDDQA